MLIEKMAESRGAWNLTKRAKAAGKERGAKVLRSELIYKGRVFEIRREQVIEPSGLRVMREVVVHHGSVVVLPVTKDADIVLIRQYRHAAGQYLWELVAGHREPDETFAEGAPRELKEETGYTAKRFKKLLEIFPSPGLLGEIMEIYLAEGLTKGEAHPEEDEKITVKVLSLKEALRWIRQGKIRDAKSVAGILYYAQFVAKK
jgi:ADP-ribose pyrophosphatase